MVVQHRNYCFPTKVATTWRQLDGHVRLVEGYLEKAGNFRNLRGLDRSPRRLFSDPLYAAVGESAGQHRS